MMAVPGTKCKITASVASVDTELVGHVVSRPVILSGDIVGKHGGCGTCKSPSWGLSLGGSETLPQQTEDKEVLLPGLFCEVKQCNIPLLV